MYNAHLELILLPISAVGNHLLRQVLGKSLWKKSTGILISGAILLLLQIGIASFLTILTERCASAKGKNTVIPLRNSFKKDILYKNGHILIEIK